MFIAVIASKSPATSSIDRIRHRVFVMSTHPGQESFGDKIKRVGNNCFQTTLLRCNKAKDQSQIAMLDQKIVSRQRQFGVEYLTLIEQKASQEELKACLKRALNDINKIQAQINGHYDHIDEKQGETKAKLIAPAGGNQTGSVAPPQGSTVNQKGKKPMIKNPAESHRHPSQNTSPVKKGSSPSPRINGSPSKPSRKPAPGNTRPDGGRTPGNQKQNKPSGINMSGEVGSGQAFPNANATKWKVKESTFQGSASYNKKGKEESVVGSIPDGIRHFRANPEKYTAFLYQTSMITEKWPESSHKYTLVHREGTENYKPQGVSPSGWMTILLQEYERIPPFPDDVLPKKFRDNYTDEMTFQKRKLHTKNKPIMPGRGMGCGDVPSLKIIGDVDPSDIAQGQVGNCWMLSGISCLAEFDGAVSTLFRKTKGLGEMPRDGPNKYIVTLWDLPTWTEVDIEIDERLACGPDGNLLASRPSEDGELWVPYLEKALAIHCGGWDKIVGGQCTHVWALMTGCREQYTIQRDKKKGNKFGCYGKFNPYKQKWADQANSPHDGDGTVWACPWPQAGGGGSPDLRLTDEELFERMVAWDKQNYIVAAGTRGTSDKHSTGGIVDNHAYSVIESHSNVAGSGIDLLKVRNPWGSGEIEDGEFDDDGPGWDKYPQVKKALNPTSKDDGIFWVTRKEFFHFYGTIYVCAHDMSTFVG